jgi:type I restriction-modification system DNA methylase subunit
MITLNEITNHLRSYRNHVIDEKREANGEVFTPTDLVRQILDQFPNSEFVDPSKTWIDHSCGNGQLLSEVLIRKLENTHDFEQALATIYGVEICEENVLECRNRLLCGREDLRHIVEQNIVCADALRYHYRFDGSYPYDDEAKDLKNEELKNQLFDFE